MWASFTAHQLSSFLADITLMIPLSFFWLTFFFLLLLIFILFTSRPLFYFHFRFIRKWSFPWSSSSPALWPFLFSTLFFIIRTRTFKILFVICSVFAISSIHLSTYFIVVLLIHISHLVFLFFLCLLLLLIIKLSFHKLICIPVKKSHRNVECINVFKTTVYLKVVPPGISQFLRVPELK